MLLNTGVKNWCSSLLPGVLSVTLKPIQYLPPAAVGGIVDQLADKPINPNKKVYVLALGVAGAFNCDN
jgi:hypothetical protein